MTSSLRLLVRNKSHAPQFREWVAPVNPAGRGERSKSNADTGLSMIHDNRITCEIEPPTHGRAEG